MKKLERFTEKVLRQGRRKSARVAAQLFALAAVVETTACQACRYGGPYADVEFATVSEELGGLPKARFDAFRFVITVGDKTAVCEAESCDKSFATHSLTSKHSILLDDVSGLEHPIIEVYEGDTLVFVGDEELGMSNIRCGCDEDLPGCRDSEKIVAKRYAKTYALDVDDLLE